MSKLLDRTAAELANPNGANAGVSRETPALALPIERVHDNPYQPRQHYDAEHILNLALSIKQLKRELPATRGLQQIPLARLGLYNAGGEFVIVPRSFYSSTIDLRNLLADPTTEGQLMFGHSRLRAWRICRWGLGILLGKSEDDLGEMGVGIELPSGYDREFEERYTDLMEPDPDYAAIPLTLGFALDIDMWRHAITENSQRKNINPIEEAATMARAQAEFGLTDEEAGRPFGYARSTAANKMRLLALPAEVQRDIATGKLAERHGRELLRLADDKIRLKRAYETAVKRGQTVAQLTQNVDSEAKALKEEREERRQREAAQAILDAGWTPPGSDQPLPADRLVVESYMASLFDWAKSDHRALLERGICGSHCECCVLAYNKWGDGIATMCRPDAAQAPGYGLGCTNPSRRRDQLDMLQETGAPIQPTEEEAQRSAARAERDEKVNELKRQTRERWDAAMKRINTPDLWGDMRFWRALASHVHCGYWMDKALRGAQSIEEAQAHLLELMYQNARRYDTVLSESVPDLAAIDRIITALTRPLEQPDQPGPGDSQRTGWEDDWTEDDQVEYDELTGDDRPDEEILAYVSDWIDGGEFDSPRVLLRVIEECDDKAVRGQLWRYYNELENKSERDQHKGVSQETVEEEQP